jgi:malate permease and related proteins
MFPITFQTSTIAVAQIFAMGAVGFYLVRSGVVSEAGLKLLSFLTVNLFFPLFIFYQIITNFNASHMPFWWGFPLVAIILPLTGLGLTSILMFRHRRPHKNAFLAVASFHNGGYLPLLVVTALPLGAWAAQAYAGVIFSIVGFDMCVWSLGVWLLTKDGASRMDFRKILNPPLISMFAAWIIVLTLGPGFVPQVFLKPISILGQGTMGFAMILIGGNLGMASLARVNWTEISTIVLFKLFLLPLLTLIVLLVVKLNPLISFIAMLNACMPCSITLSIIGRNYETKDQPLINQAIFVTHLLSIITIPIFLGLYGKLIN